MQNSTQQFSEVLKQVLYKYTKTYVRLYSKIRNNYEIVQQKKFIILIKLQLTRSFKLDINTKVDQQRFADYRVL